MVKTKRVSRKEKRQASTHSSQDEDPHPRKALKPGKNNSDTASRIQMINSSDLGRYRENQHQRPKLAAEGFDGWTNPPGIRPPPRSGFGRRTYAVLQPSPVEVDEESGEDEEQFEISYGGNDSEERDQRISGWAGSVAGAEAGDPDVGVEHDQANVRSSLPSPSGVADAHDGDDKDEYNKNAAEEESVGPSIEIDSACANTGAATRAVVPGQFPTQTLRRSSRHRQNTHVSIARIPDKHFDPVAHLNNSSVGVLNLFNKPQKSGVKGLSISPRVLFDGYKFIDQQPLFKSFGHAGRKSQVLDLKPNGVPVKSSVESRNSTVDTSLGASQQNAAIKYFDRDHPVNHGCAFISNSLSENSRTSSSHKVSNAQAVLNSDYFPVSTLNYGTSHISSKIGTCAFADCLCHRAAAPRLNRRYVIHAPGGAWIFLPTVEREYFSSLTYIGEAKSHHDRDYFPAFEYEQHSLGYGSELREYRDYFPMQTCVLDYDGDAGMKEEPDSEAARSPEEDDDEDDNGEDGGAGAGDSPPADENGACNGDSDDEHPEDKEQEIELETSDSGSDNSDTELESEESVQGSEIPVSSENADDSAEQDKSDGETASDYAETHPNNATVTLWRTTDPWGRIRPPQAQGIRTPLRLVFPSAPSYHLLIPQSGALGPRRDGSNNTLILPNHDTFGTIRPPARQVPRLARRGGLPNVPFAGRQMRQNTAANRARDEPLSAGRGVVSVSIAEQQVPQMLHAYDGVRAVVRADAEGDDAEGEREQGESHDAEEAGAENDDAGDGEATGYDGDEE